MTYCHFTFMFIFIFQLVFMFHFKFMFHEHIYTYCISYTFHFFMPLTYDISYTYTYTGILTYSHIIHVFLFLYESTLLRNWNHSNRIIQTQVMAFSCKLVGLPILPRDSLKYSFSSAFYLYLTLVLYTPLKLRR